MGPIEQSESEQAADLVKRYVLLGALGVEVVQWCYLTEPQYEGTGVGFFDQSGLIYDGRGPYDRGAGVRKRAFHAYRHLVEALRGAELVGRNTEDGITAVRFGGQDGPITVLWQDPWRRTGPVWITPNAPLRVEGLCGEILAEHDGTFRLDLSIEPVYLLGADVEIRPSAPPLSAPDS
jgi:hypothetical protein